MIDTFLLFLTRRKEKAHPDDETCLAQADMPCAPCTEYIAQPLVIAMETVIITRPLRRVTEIIVVETFTVTVNTTINGTIPYLGNGTMPYNWNGTFPSNGTTYPLNGTFPANGTAGAWNRTLPASLATIGIAYCQYNATTWSQVST